MKKVIAVLVVTGGLVSGCTSVPMEDKSIADKARAASPADGKSGIYVYRPSSFGGALKKDVYIDDNCLGETAPYVFLYREVEGDKQYIISTESEFSPNDTQLWVDSGVNYYLKQYIKLGVFVGGADLELVSAAEAQKELATLGMAKSGTCSR